jgi:multidrug resistance efflux pump
MQKLTTVLMAKIDENKNALENLTAEVNELKENERKQQEHLIHQHKINNDYLLQEMEQMHRLVQKFTALSQSQIEQLKNVKTAAKPIELPQPPVDSVCYCKH